jgi:queuosine precursor transporter
VNRVLLAVAYIGSILAANWLSAHFGLVPIGLGLLVSAGTFAAGAALLVRNIGQDVLGRLVILGLMVIGVALSWWLSTPALAIASATAFALSELADMTIYTALRRRGRSRALLAAALVGSLIDTIVFLHIAGFPVTADSVTGQMLVKVGISGIVAAAIAVRSRRKAVTA